MFARRIAATCFVAALKPVSASWLLTVVSNLRKNSISWFSNPLCSHSMSIAQNSRGVKAHPVEFVGVNKPHASVKFASRDKAHDSMPSPCVAMLPMRCPATRTNAVSSYASKCSYIANAHAVLASSCALNSSRRRSAILANALKSCSSC